MNKKTNFPSVLVYFCLSFFMFSPLHAQNLEEQVVREDDATQPAKKGATGRAAAAKYFEKRSVASISPADSEHYLAIHVGTALDDNAYRWGSARQESGVGDLTAGVTYRMGEWVNSMDLALRADFIAYDLKEARPVKMSVMPIVFFPDSRSGFPIYFGAGVGMGVYFKQIHNESAISFDYQLLGGVRFLNVFEHTGFFLEGGLKNHVHLLSDGQYNGVFIAAGSVFTF